MSLPLNFSAPTGQVQNTYAAPTRTNPYLTPSQYSGMQLHQPSGLYYQGGKIYEPFTPEPPTTLSFFGSPNIYSLNQNRLPNPFDYNPKPPTKDTSIKIGDQYFRQFTGNADGIVNGNLSMVNMLNQQPTYQPQGIPSNLFNFLSSPNMQQATNQQSSGAGRFLGLLGSPTTTNTQGK